MKHLSWLISRYFITTILPYFVFSWLLLSVILFVQQASRYSDIFFSVNIPTNLIWQLSIALVPNVIAFTCPMAMLVGTIIGLTKMQGDSELVAVRAAGVGAFQMAIPIFLLGLVMSAFAFVVNLKGVPLAASLVRSVALQTAIKKLESPIEPGVFNTEIAGSTIYVKGGDVETGEWRNVFVYNEDKGAATIRLITSSNGRIDISGQSSELVLENATVITLPALPGSGKYISENIKEIRFAIKTKRSDLIDKLSKTEVSPDELGLSELSRYAATKDGSERVEAEILWQRRILLSITPLIFCLLGTFIVLRFNRGGRQFGVSLALAVLVGFYLLAFLGEQLARLGILSVFWGGMLPLAGSLAVLMWLRYGPRVPALGILSESAKRLVANVRSAPNSIQLRNIFVDLTTGLRDFDVGSSLIKNFFLTLFFLSTIFLIFTAFELWKFAGAFSGGIVLLVKYLFYLLPFIYLQIAPSAAMIGILATYVVKSRQNEVVTWTSAGQSVYRLLMPCFVLMIVLGGVNWFIQEGILPKANRRQEAIRTLIRNRGVSPEKPGRYWVANEHRIYSFELADAADEAAAEGGPQPSRNLAGAATASDNDNRLWYDPPVTKGTRYRITDPDDGERGHGITAAINDLAAENSTGNRNGYFGVVSPTLSMLVNLPAVFIEPPIASDNERSIDPCQGRCLRNVVVYDFLPSGANLQSIYRSDAAFWESGQIHFVGKVEKDVLNGGEIASAIQIDGQIEEAANPFAELRSKPNHISASGLRHQLATVDSELDRRNLQVALQKKYTTLFLPLVMALFTAPFSLSLSRKGKALTVGYAIGLWLLFTGTSNMFEQLGLNGLLSASLAVWSPLAIFSLFGIYLLSKVRT